jgi:hydroxymethylpyrimidine/phosphomethylpyrimidine kinase
MQSVQLAKTYITLAIEAGKDIKLGKGNGPVKHFLNLKKMWV